MSGKRCGQAQGDSSVKDGLADHILYMYITYISPSWASMSPCGWTQIRDRSQRNILLPFDVLCAIHQSHSLESEIDPIEASYLIFASSAILFRLSTSQPITNLSDSLCLSHDTTISGCNFLIVIYLSRWTSFPFSMGVAHRSGARSQSPLSMSTRASAQ